MYVKEPHGTDEWWIGTYEGESDFFSEIVGGGGHGKAAIDIRTARTFGERCEAAKRLKEELDYQIPIVVDKMDDAVNNAYVGTPVRFYLIGLDGKVLFDCGKGPFGVHQNGVKRFEQAIVDHIESKST